MPSAVSSSSPKATPTSAPTSVPTPTPTAGPTATPALVPLTASPNPLDVGNTGPQTIEVDEAGYRGTYAVTTDDANVVSVPASPVTSNSDTTAIGVTSNNAGSANVTIRDAHGQSVVVPVVVTLTPVIISITHLSHEFDR
jgi:hypothetical protein